MEPILKIAEAFPIGTIKEITPLSGGLIHTTYKVLSESGTYILQRMNPIFGAEVLEDMDAVTKYVELRGGITFTILKTHDNQLSVYDGTHHWRMITYIEGRVVQNGGTLEEVKNAGKLIGEFHEQLRNFTIPLKHRIPGFHETSRYMEHLADVDTAAQGTQKYDTLHPYVLRIQNDYAALSPDVLNSTLRVLHGDPQLENILFEPANAQAKALIDLDTVGMYPYLIEIGDIAWSWTKVTIDGKTQFSPERWIAAFTGYREGARSIRDAEWQAFPDAAVLTSLELASRYIADAYEESYFTHDPARYPTLFDQNLTRAKELFAFLDDFALKQHYIRNMHQA